MAMGELHRAGGAEVLKGEQRTGTTFTSFGRGRSLGGGQNDVLTTDLEEHHSV